MMNFYLERRRETSVANERNDGVSGKHLLISEYPVMRGREHCLRPDALLNGKTDCYSHRTE